MRQQHVCRWIQKMKESYHHKQVKSQRSKSKQKNMITKRRNIVIREGWRWRRKDGFGGLSTQFLFFWIDVIWPSNCPSLMLCWFLLMWKVRCWFLMLGSCLHCNQSSLPCTFRVFVFFFSSTCLGLLVCFSQNHSLSKLHFLLFLFISLFLPFEDPSCIIECGWLCL